MNSPALERFLARLYLDANLRAKFLLSPHEEAARAGLSAEQCRALENVDRIGLEMAARSFARKRAVKGQHGKRRWVQALVQALRNRRRQVS